MTEGDRTQPATEAASEAEKAIKNWVDTFSGMQRYADLLRVPANKVKPVSRRVAFPGNGDYFFRFTPAMAYPTGRLRNMTVNVYRAEMVDEKENKVHIQETVLDGEWRGQDLDRIEYVTTSIGATEHAFSPLILSNTSKILMEAIIAGALVEIPSPEASIHLDAISGYAPGVN